MVKLSYFYLLLLVLLCSCNVQLQESDVALPNLYQPATTHLFTEATDSSSSSQNTSFSLYNESGEQIPTGVPISIATKSTQLAGQPTTVTTLHQKWKKKDASQIKALGKVREGNFQGKSLAVSQESKNFIKSNGDTVQTRLALPLVSNRKRTPVFTASTPVAPMNMKDAAQVPISFFSINQGLPSANVYDMYQDSQGVLWLGISKGMVRYDGNTCTHFTAQTGFTDNLVYAVEGDAEGNIWFGTYGDGVIKYDGQQFTTFGMTEGMMSNSVLFIQREQSDLWFGMVNGGISRYDGKSITHFTTEDGLPNNMVKTMLKDRKGNRWLGTFEGVVKMATDSMIQYSPQGEILRSIYSIKEDRKGNIWFATQTGVFMSEGNTTIHQYSKESGLPDNRINDIIEDKSGAIWMGTFEGGVTKLQHNQLHYFRTSEGLSSNLIQQLQIDPQQNLWVSTSGGGINKLKLSSFQHFTINEGSTANIVKSIAQGTNGELWLATYGGGFVHLTDKSYHAYLAGKDRFNGMEVLLSNAIDQKGNSWFGSLNDGVFYFDGNSVKNFTTAHGLLNNTIRALHVDQKGNLWLGSYGGLSRFDGKEFTHYTTKSGLPSNQINAITEDNTGNLWLGTSAGLVKMADNNFTIFSRKEGLASNAITSIAVDDQQRVWVGMKDAGLAVIDDRGITSFNKEQGLLSDQVRSLMVDQKGGLWLGTNKGLNYIQTVQQGKERKYKLFAFDKDNGLKGLDFQTNSVFIDEQQQIYWGTGAGITTLAISEFQLPSLKPNVQLNRIDLMGKSYNFRSFQDSTGSITFKEVAAFQNYPKQLELGYDQNHLSFHFSAIDWRNSHQVRYVYRIKELEKQWTVPAKHTFADYRNLPHGDYTFQVCAISAAQEWGDVFSYEFTILTPWWHTWWARCLYIIGILLAVIGYGKLRTHYLKKRQKALEQKVKESTAEILIQKQEAEKQRDLVKEKSKALKATNSELQVINEELQQTQEEIATQRDALEINNQELSKYKLHTSQSIESATLIQDAILPTSEALQEVFSDHFVLFLPKDTVSGDFYWMHRQEGKTIFVLADCTGHGIPGAFMTMIGNSILDQIIRIDQVWSPVEIMEKMHEKIQLLLHQEETNVQNGMDMSIVTIEEQGDALKVVFGGAKQNLLYIDGNQLIKVKGSRSSIGGTFQQKTTFTEDELLLKAGTQVYLYSDGYVDQNLPNSRKKIGSSYFRQQLESFSQQSFPTQKKQLTDLLALHLPDREQRDDITVIGLKLKHSKAE